MVNFVLDFAERLLALGAEDDAASGPLVASYLSLLLLSHLTTFVERTKGYQDISTPLTQRQIGLLAHIVDGVQVESLLGLLTPLLRMATRAVPEGRSAQRSTVDSLLTHTLYNPYSLRTHSFLDFPSWFAGISHI